MTRFCNQQITALVITPSHVPFIAHLLYARHWAERFLLIFKQPSDEAVTVIVPVSCPRRQLPPAPQVLSWSQDTPLSLAHQRDGRGVHALILPYSGVRAPGVGRGQGEGTQSSGETGNDPRST